MPYVKYLQLNDLTENHLQVLKYANRFFLVDMPLSDEDFHLVDNSEFVEEIIEHKAFVLLDNSKGTGKESPKTDFIKKINKLLSKGISDIAIAGGFGPDSLSIYFEIKEYYKINFPIAAETRLKTGDLIDMQKVKSYLSELIKHKYEYISKR